MATPNTLPLDRQTPDKAEAPAVHVGFLIAFVFALSVLKGLRMPSLWAVTHMTFNYSHGFIRRGLFGQVLRLFGEDRIYHYRFLAGCAALLFVLVAVSMLRLLRAALAADRQDRGLQAVALVLAASPATVFLAHETGYLDYVGIMAVPFYIVWAARSRHPYLIFYVAMAVSVCLALVHESMIVMFAPALVFTMLCRVLSRSSCTGESARAKQSTTTTGLLPWVHVALAGLVALAASWVAGSAGTRGPDVTRALQDSIAAHANFPLRGDGFDAIGRSLKENFFEVLPRHWSHPDNRNYLITSLVVIFPALAFVGYYGVRLIARLPLAQRCRALLTGVFLAATAGPLFLNLIGWDSARWNTVALFASFFCVASVRIFFVAPAVATDGHAQRYRVDDSLTLTLAAVAIVAGLCTSYQGFLYDGFVVQWFPFRAQLESAIDTIKDGFQSIPRM